MVVYMSVRERPVGAQPAGLGRPGWGLRTCEVPAPAAKRAGREAGPKYSVYAAFPYFVQTREGYPRPVVRVLLLLLGPVRAYEGRARCTVL